MESRITNPMLSAELQAWVDDYNEEETTMKWADTGGGHDFAQPPLGTHPARCVRIIDIGTQKGEYQGEANIRRQCIIAWELPTELMPDGEKAGQPFLVSKFYTASLSEKANLRKDLENWRTRAFTKEELGGFESKNILGKPCMLSLSANDKGKVRVTGVMALPKGMEIPPQVNGNVYFSLERAEFKTDVFESLSEGYKKMIRVSPEYQELLKPEVKRVPAGKFDDLDDDIPFANPYRGRLCYVV